MASRELKSSATCCVRANIKAPRYINASKKGHNPEYTICSVILCREKKKRRTHAGRTKALLSKKTVSVFIFILKVIRILV
jgi:hypothetical protein